jgi:hypothetical protein
LARRVWAARGGRRACAGRGAAGAALCVRRGARRRARGAGRGPRAGGGMEELSSVGEQVFAAECILSKRLRKVRASPPAAAAPGAPRRAAHRPLFSPRRASWSTWSSGAAGPPSESTRRARFPARASRCGGGGVGTLAGSGVCAVRTGSSLSRHAHCGRGAPARPGAALCLRARGERSWVVSSLGSPHAPARPTVPPPPRRARLPRPFVACARGWRETQAPLYLSVLTPL